MKYSTILDVYKATEALADKPFTNQQQWDIYKFRKALREHKDFYEEREKAINEKYLPYADEKGILSGEKYLEYMKEKSELNNLDAEFTYDKFTLPIVDGINFKIIEPLEDYIEFTI